MLSRAFTVAVLATATLFVGSLASARGSDSSCGVARAHSCSIDAAALGDVTDAETEADDTDCCSFDGDWSSCGLVDGTTLPTGGGRFIAARRAVSTRQHCRATSLIRGPPRRG